jgi:hypothetical protein
MQCAHSSLTRLSSPYGLARVRSAFNPLALWTVILPPTTKFNVSAATSQCTRSFSNATLPNGNIIKEKALNSKHYSSLMISWKHSSCSFSTSPSSNVSTLSWLRGDSNNNIVTIAVIVKPNARSTSITDVHNDELGIKLAAPPR